MSIQSALNQEAIDMLPIIKEAISVADSFEANQMKQHTIRACMNSEKSIDT